MMRVLVVEDREYTQDSLEAYLRMNGWDTDYANNGYGAIARMGVHVPDAIVADYLMPAMNGVELINVLRADARYEKIPVALISGLPEADMPALMEEVNKIPLVRFFHKPFEPAVLLGWLKEVTNKVTEVGTAGDEVKPVTPSPNKE
jgi:CheY-like chemotaxis protein